MDRRTRFANFWVPAIAQTERLIAPAITMSPLRAKDTVSLNKDSQRGRKNRLRFHLVLDVIDRVPGLAERGAHLRQEMVDTRLRYRAWTREHGEDHPDVRDWAWPG